VQPPLSRPDTGFWHLEVPQVEVVAGRPVLIFSCLPAQLSQERLADFLVQRDVRYGGHDRILLRRGLRSRSSRPCPALAGLFRRPRPDLDFVQRCGQGAERGYRIGQDLLAHDRRQSAGRRRIV